MRDRLVPRRDVLRTGGLLVTGMAGCLSTGRPDTVEFADGFEDGYEGWETDADVPDDPNALGNQVEWEIAHSTERAAAGSASLRYYLDGRQDDGTIWIVRPLAVEAGRSYDVTVRTEAWSASESFNTLAYLVMYAGSDRPTSEESFPEPGTNTTGAGITERGGLREVLNQTEGWIAYSFDWETPSLETDTVYVAAGISAVWETEMTYFIDDIEVSATPT